MERAPLTPGLIIYLVAFCAVVLWWVVIDPILAWRSRRRWRWVRAPGFPVVSASGEAEDEVAAGSAVGGVGETHPAKRVG